MRRESAHIVRAEKPPTRRSRCASMLHHTLRFGQDREWVLVPLPEIEMSTVLSVTVHYESGTLIRKHHVNVERD